MTLFDRQEADQAIDTAEAHADREWDALYYMCIISMAVLHEAFTTGDITDFYHSDPDAPETHDLRAIGALIRRAIREGLIERTGEWRPSGPHGRPQRVWRSRIYRKDWA